MTVMDANSHMCTIHMQTQTIGAFATFKFSAYLGRFIPSIITLVFEFFQGKNLLATQKTLKAIMKCLTCFGAYKTSSWNKTIFFFVIFSLVFLGINRKEDVSIILYLAR